MNLHNFMHCPAVTWLDNCMTQQVHRCSIKVVSECAFTTCINYSWNYFSFCLISDFHFLFSTFLFLFFTPHSSFPLFFPSSASSSISFLLFLLFVHSHSLNLPVSISFFLFSLPAFFCILSYFLTFPFFLFLNLSPFYFQGRSSFILFLCFLPFCLCFFSCILSIISPSLPSFPQFLTVVVTCLAVQYLTEHYLSPFCDWSFITLEPLVLQKDSV